MEHHVAPTKLYFGIFAALMACTFLTVFVRLNLEIKSITIALSIAVVKATLVILYFMHVKYSHVLTKLAVWIAVVFLGILLVLMSMDYASRGWQYHEPGWEKQGVLKN
jgi:cytochrome c oxidase subunit 4